MATKLDNLELEIAHFRNFIDRIPGAAKWCKNTVESILSLGLIQVSTAFEHAIANTGGHTVISEDAADFDDGTVGGSDAKLVTVRTSSYGRSYSAPVSNIAGKTGTLRVQVFERKKNKFYYFLIPYEAYCHVPRTSNIEIPFELDGQPRRIPKGPVKRNWWNFEVSSFDEMSK